ncbi:MAG: hypothetical protein GWP10_19630 [Nitrospiraceae bacterium]|nr:hypothetical protein [Nitrospiraceae bacterium]
MVEKRKQGQKYPEGYIKNQIILKLCEKDKTETSEIMDYLKERFGIRDTKGIRDHLTALEAKKLIKRESAGLGHPDYWDVGTDLHVFKTLLDMFAETEFEADFLETEYCSSMVFFDDEHFELFDSWYDSRADVLVEKIRNLMRKFSEFYAHLFDTLHDDPEFETFRHIIGSIAPSCIDPEKLDAAVMQAYRDG